MSPGVGVNIADHHRPVPFPGKDVDFGAFFFFSFLFFCESVHFVFVFSWPSGQPWIWLCVLARDPGSTLKAVFSCAVPEANTLRCWQNSLEEVTHRIWWKLSGALKFGGFVESGFFTGTLLFFSLQLPHLCSPRGEREIESKLVSVLYLWEVVRAKLEWMTTFCTMLNSKYQHLTALTGNERVKLYLWHMWCAVLEYQIKIRLTSYFMLTWWQNCYNWSSKSFWHSRSSHISMWWKEQS